MPPQRSLGTPGRPNRCMPIRVPDRFPSKPCSSLIVPISLGRLPLPRLHIPAPGCKKLLKGTTLWRLGRTFGLTRSFIDSYLGPNDPFINPYLIPNGPLINPYLGSLERAGPIAVLRRDPKPPSLALLVVQVQVACSAGLLGALRVPDSGGARGARGPNSV